MRLSLVKQRHLKKVTYYFKPQLGEALIMLLVAIKFNKSYFVVLVYIILIEGLRKFSSRNTR